LADVSHCVTQNRVFGHSNFCYSDFSQTVVPEPLLARVRFLSGPRRKYKSNHKNSKILKINKFEPYTLLINNIAGNIMSLIPVFNQSFQFHLFFKHKEMLVETENVKFHLVTGQDTINCKNLFCTCLSVCA